MADASYLYQFRLILIGDSTVGKSSLLQQFKEGVHYRDITLTVGVDFHAKLIYVDGQPIKLQLWDTAGQDRFRSIVRAYYRNAAGGLLCFDITNRESFANLTDWMNDAKRNAEPHSPVFVLVGNKADQEKYREVTRQEGIRFAQDHDMEYIETSAKSGLNVEEAFVMLAHKIYSMLSDGAMHVEEGWDGVKKGDYSSRKSTSLVRNGSRSGQGMGVVTVSNGASGERAKKPCCSR